MGARAYLVSLAVVAALVAGCDDSSNGTPVITVNGQPLVVTGTTAQYAAVTTNGGDTGYIWSTDDPLIATISVTGLLTAHDTGNVQVRAVGNVTGIMGTLTIACSSVPTDVVPYYDEWANSPHNDATAEAFTHWDGDADQDIEASCARCHSTPGFHDFLGEDGTAAGTVENDAPIGTTVECIACHNDSSLVYSEVTFPSGAVISGLGREAVCMTCHQGRESTESVDDKIAAANPPDDDTVMPDVGFINVHYFPAAATRYGGQVDGGYTYEGKSYDVLFKHVPGLERCQDCHDQHTLEIRLDVCSDCHNVTTKNDLYAIRMESSRVNDYDGDGDLVEGLYFEIDTLRDKLMLAMQNYAREVIGQPMAYDGSSYPYWFKDTNDNGVVDDAERSNANRFSTFSARLLKASYNYQYAVKDPGGFAHNGKFIIQILHDSIEDVNSAISAPVDMSAARRNDHGHFDGTAEPFRHWDEDGEVSSSCAKCHSASAGFEEFLVYGKNTSQEIANGFDCAVCHTTFDTFETRRITQVTFPPVPGGRTTPAIGGAVPTDDPLVQSNICITCHQGRESKKTIDDAIVAWIAAGKPAYPTSGSLGFKNVHYLSAAADVFGTEAQVAYEYTRSYGAVTIQTWVHNTAYAVGTKVANAGRTYECIQAGTSDPDPGSGPKTTGLDITDGTVHWKTWYSNKFPHAAAGSNTNNCVFCHSPVNTKHTFLPNDNIDMCKICHAGLTNDVSVIRLNRPFDYDGDGNTTEKLNDEVQGLAARLLTAIQDYARTTPGRGPIAYNGASHPYFYKDLNDNGVVDPNEAVSSNAYRNFDEKLLPACHNYQQSQKEPGAWAHSVDYVAQCCYDAIADLDGDLTGLTRAPVNY